MRLFLLGFFIILLGCNEDEITTEPTPEAPTDTVEMFLPSESDVLLDISDSLTRVRLDDNPQILLLNNGQLAINSGQLIRRATINLNPDFSLVTGTLNVSETILTQKETNELKDGFTFYNFDVGITVRFDKTLVTDCKPTGNWVERVTTEDCISSINSSVLQLSSEDIQSDPLQFEISVKDGSVVTQSFPTFLFSITEVNLPFSVDEVQNPVEYNGDMFFKSSLSGSEKLYKIDDTEVRRISNVRSGDDNIDFIKSEPDGLYFVAGNSKIYKYIEGSERYYQISDINGSSRLDFISEIEKTPNSFYFISAATSTGQKRLHIFDGVNTEVIDFDISPGRDEFSNIYYSGGYVYFNSKDSNENVKFWRYDPLFNGGIGLYEKVIDLISNNDDQIEIIGELNGYLYITGINSLNQKKMYKIENSTKLVSQVGSTNSFGSDDIKEPILVGNKIFMSAKNQDGFEKLFYYDTVENLYIQVTDFSSSGERIDNIAGVDDFIYFSSEIDNSGNDKFFIYDIEKKSLIQASNFNNGAPDGIEDVIAIGDFVYFKALDGSQKKLFKLCRNCN